ncbi:U3-aranetoxin-Ce1a-like isoform X2 [Mytilus galloprovincialis]|uniref:U3-aranetoxin-Ce1a-like isoform X2 n=1 Tax=Mytilus galloprovincialis TaxID=29158 RepID=UPI003F7BB2E2
MWKEILVVLVITCAVATASKDECRHDSQCGSDECCYYHEGPLMVSKKRQSIFFPVTVPMVFQGGWCEKYLKQGEHCNHHNKMNGHCECGAGLSCAFIADPTLPPMTPSGIMTAEHKRMLFFGGHSECQPVPLS